MRVLVLGGTGFIGRHAVAALLERGHDVAIGSRFPARSARKLPPADRNRELRVVFLERLLEPDAWRPLLADCEVVVNCVGILRPRGAATYEKVHHLAPAALAVACERFGVARLVHVSALGLHAGARSGFLVSKLRGEQALLQRRVDLSIVRPSLLDGEGGYGAAWLRRVAGWPIHVVPASATGLLAPLAVTDLGVALARLSEIRGRAELREVDLGGPDRWTMREYLAELRKRKGLPAARCVPLPHALARLGSHVCDVLHVTPYSFGHLELLQRGNVPLVNRLPELLAADQVVASERRRFGGGNFASIAARSAASS